MIGGSTSGNSKLCLKQVMVVFKEGKQVQIHLKAY